MKSIINEKKVRTPEKIFAFLFAFFFVAQILSPSINQRTIYLEMVLMVVNPFFWKWILPVKLTYRNSAIIIIFLMICIVGHPVTALKILLNIFGATALIYLWKRKIWYVDSFIYLSIIIAIIQMLLLTVNREMAFMLGPSNISEMVWGSFATPTYTNFFDAMGIGLPRVSGLSREAGFFASLLVVAIIHRTLNGEKSIFAKGLYLVGYVISFSKMSFVIIPAWFIAKLKSYINKINLVVCFMCFLIIMLMLWSGRSEFLNDMSNVTYLSRFGAYDSLLYLDVNQLLLGEENLSKIGGISAINEYYGGNLYAGLGGWIINNGIIVILLFIMLMFIMKVSSAGVVLLLLFSINVQPDTNQNFVVYAWFLCMNYFREK